MPAKDPNASAAKHRAKIGYRGRLNKWIKCVYGIDVEQYEQMVVNQDGKCAICGRIPEVKSTKRHRGLHIDHNHKTGSVRGLLCARCNPPLAFVEDSKWLIKALQYLEKYKV